MQIVFFLIKNYYEKTTLFIICLIGCSDDDGISDTDGTDTQLLVKSINWTRTNEGSTENGSEEFTYDGNKIVQVLLMKLKSLRRMLKK